MGRGRRGAITPYLQDSRATFIATFRDRTGKRVTRSLATADEAAAKQICASLEQLQHDAVKDVRDVPASIHPKAFELFFGTQSLSELVDEFVKKGIETTPGQLEEAARHAARPDADRVMLFIKLQQSRSELEEEKRANLDLRRGLERTTRELAGLKSSVIAHAAQRKRPPCPAAEAALAEFEEHLRASVTHPRSFISVAGSVRRFLQSLPPELRCGPVEGIGAREIVRFLDALPGSPARRLSRRQKWRTRLGRFLNWAARTYDYASPMQEVPNVSDALVEQERGDIVWHSPLEIEAAIRRAPDAYWKAVIGTIAYAGLRVAELIWLRVEDVDLTQGIIWVTSVTDGAARHVVKSVHSRRSVRIHPRLLKPLLSSYAEAGLPGTTFFFPMPAAMRRRVRTKTAGHAERWRDDVFCAKARQVLQSAKTGIMPRTLRHTFGSLLIRSGRNVTEVAAAMGNTPDVVSRHYARLLGSEVDVNF